VARIAPRADPGTRQVMVASQLANPDSRVVAGQFARGRILTGSPRSMVAIPARAVEDTAGQSRVLLIENGKLVQRIVSLGPRDDAAGLVGITEGLQAGDRVLASRVTGAAPGLAVRLPADTSERQPPIPPPSGRE
jgi:hypothetical protein